MTDSVDQNRDAWARVLLMMAIVDNHLDSDGEIPKLKELLAEMGVPQGELGRLFFEAAQGWDDPVKRHEMVQQLSKVEPEELMVRVRRCIEVMDADGMRHQQEFVFLSQVMDKLEAGEAFNQLFSTPF